METVVPAFFKLAVKANLNRLCGTGNKQRRAAGQPVIGKLGLPAFFEFLLEDTVLIEYRIACGVVAVGSESVEVAGSKSAETAVSETRVRLHLIDGIDRDTEVFQHSDSLINHFEVVDTGFKAAAHKEFHRKVVHLLMTLGAVLNGEFAAFCFENADNYLGERLIDLLVGSFIGGGLEIVVKHVDKLLLQIFLGNGFCHDISS